MEIKSYAESLSNSVHKKDQRLEVTRLCYDAKEVDMVRLKKAFVGVAHQSIMSYNIQNYFEIESYFSIKVTPLRANLCLLEEIDEGEIKHLITEGKSWWSQLFSEIREWKEEHVDKDRVTWLRVYGIPCHAWNFSFFEMLANTLGTYVYSDENVLKGTNMDITSKCILTNFIIKSNCVRTLMVL